MIIYLMQKGGKPLVPRLSKVFLPYANTLH